VAIRMIKNFKAAGKSTALVFSLVSTAVVLGGCAAAVEKEPMPVLPSRPCPASKNVDELVAAVSRRWDFVKPFKANGQCVLQYHDRKGKLHKENFAVKIWSDPPGRLCLYGDVAFNAKGIMFGCNEREFWLVLRPRELRGYWWGSQDNDWTGPEGWRCSFELPLGLSPATLFDALALVKPGAIGPDQNWQLSHKGRFDILTLLDKNRRAVKKIYVDCCDFLFYRIKYFDQQGAESVVMDLDGYEQLSETFFVPSRIQVKYYRKDHTQDIVSLQLRSLKLADFSPQQDERLFTRPPSKGFDRVYRLNDSCRFVQD